MQFLSESSRAIFWSAPSRLGALDHGHSHASVRGQREGRHTMPLDPELTGQSRKRGLPKHPQHCPRPCQALVPATGPPESAAVSACCERSISYAIAAALLQRKSVACAEPAIGSTRPSPRTCPPASADAPVGGPHTEQGFRAYLG
jgi:hypothetical protein